MACNTPRANTPLRKKTPAGTCNELTLGAVTENGRCARRVKDVVDVGARWKNRSHNSGKKQGTGEK